MASDYRKIFAYTLAYDFAIKVYKLTDAFPHEERNLKSQIRRSAISVPVNIAEGASKPTLKEFFYYCNISYASARELQVLLKLAKDLGYVSIFKYEDLIIELDNICAKIFLFLRHIESMSKNRRQFSKGNYIRKIIDSNLDHRAHSQTAPTI
ncbi:four helix bundle protein [Candidatus Woesearchaeota archaeon]|nr:MAG: four helix bundle protein [Candidatus Woesearchaeota archaeon]